MESMTGGQAIGSLVGGIIGGYIGGFPGAMLGMAIGGQIGLMLDPPDAPPPPDWGDLGKNVFVRTSPVPLCYGRNKVYGGVIWMSNLMTLMENRGGGKDGDPPSALLLLYFAVGHCEGEVLAYHQYYVDDKTVGEMAEEGWNIAFTSYYGTMTQTNDPWMAQFGGSPGIIPYIGTAYSVAQALISVEGTITITRLPSISAEISGILTENTDAATDPDANPIRVVYDFMTDTKNGMGLDTSLFNGDPDTAGSPWKYSADHCDELVSYVDENDTTIYEPRFRYSNVFDARVKGFDIVTDVLYTCRGLVRLRQGKLEAIVEGCSDFETVQMYFSDRDAQTFTVEAGSTVSRIYGSFSTYPDNYWFGDKGTITISGTDYVFYVKEQTSTYIDLFDDLGATPQTSGTFQIVKDNIKEGTFNFTETPNKDLASIYRVEYMSRAAKDENGIVRNLYQWDVVEHPRETSAASMTPYGTASETQTIKTIRMSGIKRKSQAMRMAQYFSDYIEYNKSMCNFATGLEGFLLSIGDLVGVSHIQTGWNKKIFRIVDMEETENDDVKISFLEYNSFVYSDTIRQVLSVPDTSTQSPYDYPPDVERENAVQDLTENKIYILFKRPTDTWFTGVRIYVSANGGDYMYIQPIGTTTFSVKLDSGIDDSVTTIPFDETTLYGSFPDSGAFWIEDEYITYTSIDDVNYEFEGCTRGANASAHTSDKYCSLEDNNPYITFEDSQIGQTWTIKLVSINSYGVVADFDDSPTVSLTIS